MSGALRELIAFFGVEVQGEKKLDHVGEKMKHLGELAIKAGELMGLAFGVHELIEFTKGQVEAANATMNTAEMLGVAVGELKEFRYAAYQADVSAEEADTALRFLNKNMGEAAMGAGNAAATFQRLGVKMKDQAGKTRPAIDVLGDLADGINKLDDPAKETAVAMELFGRAGARMIPLLHKGSDGIAELAKEYHELTAGGGGATAEVLEEAEHQMKRNEVATKSLKAVLAAQLIPAFTEGVKWVTELVMGFRQLAAKSYIVESAALVLAGAAVVMGVSWGLANLPILLTVVALAGVLLVIEDLMVAFKGGKSVIGGFIDDIWGIGATKTMFDSLKEWGQDVVDVFKLSAMAVKDVIATAKYGWAILKYGTGQGSDADLAKAERAYDEATAQTSFEVRDLAAKRGKLGPVRQAKSMTRGDETTVFGQDGGERTQFDFAASLMQPPPRVSATLPGTGYGGNVHHGDVQQHNEVTINVQGGASPRETGAAVGSAVRGAVPAWLQQSMAAVPGGGGV